MILKDSAPRQIADNIYWLGSVKYEDFLQINCYLIYKEGKGVIVDPGPIDIFSSILKALEKVCPLEDVRVLVLSGHGPQVCSSLPLWEEAGFQGRVICHWKTWLTVKTMGLLSPFHTIKDENHKGPEDLPLLHFLSYNSPHSPGGIMTWEPDTKTLFSAEYFGFLGKNSLLFGNDEYLSRMISFQREYFPSVEGSVQKRVFEMLETLEPGRICPANGSILEKPDMKSLITMFNPENSEDLLPQTQEVSGREDISRLRYNLNEELVRRSDEQLVDTVTGLYGNTFYNKYLTEFIDSNSAGVVAYFRMDDMKTFNNEYGLQEGDSALASFGSILQKFKPDEALLFRGAGPILILMLPDSLASRSSEIIEEMKKEVRESEEFIQSMTCSVAVSRLDEDLPESWNREDLLQSNIRERLRLLDRLGEDSICDFSGKDMMTEESPVILILDSDSHLIHLLKEACREKDYQVHSCSDGAEAVHRIDLLRPALILSEIHIPQMDGFRIREKVLESTDLRSIPTVFISFQKTEVSVKRAHQLGVYHYLKKPLMLDELQGLIHYLIEGES
ncbi:MAG: response regulator [Spirochaetales bacterium]|nr:response regulator [Spirochaetales bacterium]